jgi:CheY-like chemotaxis protein
MMSHDIRTPMTGIIGFATLLKDTPLQSHQREYLSAIEQSGESLISLLNDILDLSKIEAGQVTIDPQPFALIPCLSEIVTILQPRANAKSISLTYHVSDGIPEGIETDRTRLGQILTNLLGNAVKFTDEGSVRLHVECALPPEEGMPAQWTFQVIDTGAGIPAAQVQRIFEPFSQIEGEHRSEGFGLGLSITRQLCRQLGGEILVESVPGAGSTFTATILAPAAKPAKPEPAPVTDGKPVFSYPYLKALVVDDHVLNAKLAALMLRKAGWETVLAHDAAAAISACRSEAFNIVFMDVQMPGTDGLEATRELRRLEAGKFLAAPAPLHIVALTANVMPADRQECLDAGMDSYLEKPLREPALRRILDGAREASTAAKAFDCKDSSAA